MGRVIRMACRCTGSSAMLQDQMDREGEWQAQLCRYGGGA
jgi:hypothetical protein